MKTPVIGFAKPGHGTNIPEGNDGATGQSAGAENFDILEAALTALGVGALGVPVVKSYTSSGAIAEKSGTVELGGSAAQTMTLADPVSGTDDGKCLDIIATSAHAHICTFTTALAGGANHKATFGGAVGDTLAIKALGGKWYPRPSINQTYAAS